jgi:hypothetical protein
MDLIDALETQIPYAALTAFVTECDEDYRALLDIVRKQNLYATLPAIVALLRLL